MVAGMIKYWRKFLWVLVIIDYRYMNWHKAGMASLMGRYMILHICASWILTYVVASNFDKVAFFHDLAVMAIILVLWKINLLAGWYIAFASSFRLFGGKIKDDLRWFLRAMNNLVLIWWKGFCWQEKLRCSCLHIVGHTLVTMVLVFCEAKAMFMAVHWWVFLECLMVLMLLLCFPLVEYLNCEDIYPEGGMFSHSKVLL